MDEGEIPVNPAAKMGLRTGKPRDQIWPPEMIARIIAAAQAAGRPSIALAVTIAANTALREGDVLGLVWAAFDGQTIKVRQHKTGTMVAIPATAELRAALEAAPRLSPLILINEYTNRPWAKQAFRADFRRIATRAGLPAALRFMDLRRTGATATRRGRGDDPGNRGDHRALDRPHGADPRNVRHQDRRHGQKRDRQARAVPPRRRSENMILKSERISENSRLSAGWRPHIGLPKVNRITLHLTSRSRPGTPTSPRGDGSRPGPPPRRARGSKRGAPDQRRPGSHRSSRVASATAEDRDIVRDPAIVGHAVGLSRTWRPACARSGSCRSSQRRWSCSRRRRAAVAGAGRRHHRHRAEPGGKIALQLGISECSSHI